MAVKRIEHIDVWRFFAVMLVIQEHFLLFSGIDRYFSDIETYSLQIERFGELGVLIFFSISGFVICMGLNSEKTKTGRVCLSAFCARRFFRIVPPLWLYLAFATILSAFDLIKISGQQVLTSAAFLCNLPFEKAVRGLRDILGRWRMKSSFICYFHYFFYGRGVGINRGEF